MTDGVKARDVLENHIARNDARDAERILLAQTPWDEGVYIAPDGELWRLEPRRDPRRYRLVPIEEATDD